MLLDCMDPRPRVESNGHSIHVSGQLGEERKAKVSFLFSITFYATVSHNDWKAGLACVFLNTEDQ